MARAEDLMKRIEAGGESVIEEFIATRKSEELFLDFKRSSDHGRGIRLSDIDRNNLAKAISGFGNSEGGIVVWGVDCSRDEDGADIARFIVPIEEPYRYVSWLEGAVSGCTIPPHSGVRNYAVLRKEATSGYAITYIPTSYRAPHQVVGRMQYFIRAGSDFVPAPHMVLAGMFGRFPPPNVFHTYTVGPATLVGDAIKCQIGIMIRNNGPGIASDLFCNVMVFSFPWANSTLEFERTSADTWSGNWSFGRHISLISQPGFRVPPEAHTQPLILNISIAPPFDEQINIEGMVGSRNSDPYRFKFICTTEQLTGHYVSFVEKCRARTISRKDQHKVMSAILGILDDSMTEDA